MLCTQLQLGEKQTMGAFQQSPPTDKHKKTVRTSADRTAEHQIHRRYFDYSCQPENTTVIGPQKLN